MGGKDIIVVHDSDDDNSLSLDTMRTDTVHAFWMELERKVGQHTVKKNRASARSRKSQHSISAGGSRNTNSLKRQHALVDSLLTADSEDSEDVAGPGWRKCQHNMYAGGSRRAGSWKRQHALDDSSSMAG